jgi:hypothetical protein
LYVAAKTARPSTRPSIDYFRWRVVVSPAEAALNGRRACLSHLRADQRWNWIAGAGLTDDDRRPIASIKPFKEDLP